MSDRFWAHISIGGPIPDNLIPELHEQLENAGLVNQDDELADFVDDRDLLSFTDDEACYGCFADLEEWLRENEIEFNRQSDGCYDCSPEIILWRKGIGTVCRILDHDGHHVVHADEVRGLLSMCDIGSIILKVREILGQDVPKLNPAFGAAPQGMSSDELKRRNTDPSAMSCAQCGGSLKDPGLGPVFKHCPTCES